MSILLQSTKQYAATGVKVLVYGQAGVGKTTLIKTAPNPLILSVEGGLLSLQGADIPYIEVHSIVELGEAFMWIQQSQEAAQYKTICLDSLSELAEVCLQENKYIEKDGKKVKTDGRLAYGDTGDQVTRLIRCFRDLPGRHVYFSAKLDKSETQEGARLFAPSMPGKSMTQNLPYYFDEVLALRVVANAEGQPVRVLQTAPDTMWTAKDRSGRLSPMEPADLTYIFDKIAGAQSAEKGNK